MNGGDQPFVFASNQNYTNGYIKIFLPLNGAWPSTYVDTCDTADLCQDHYVLGHGGTVIAISGDTECHNNGPVAWRAFTAMPMDSNFSDLVSTICPGAIDTNQGNHASWSFANMVQGLPFISTTYGTFATRGSPWTAEINGVSPNPHAQNVWRLGDDQVRAAEGCYSNSVSSDGATMTVTCAAGPHSLTGTMAGELMNCANSAFNTTFSSETVVSPTKITFATAIGAGSSAYCEMYATAGASVEEFYATGLLQQSPHFAVFNENWRRSFVADATGNRCGAEQCPQIHIRVLELR